MHWHIACDRERRPSIPSLCGTDIVSIQVAVMLQAQPRVLILGTRGVPAAHGGFESFAEKLSLFLVERGWRVTVYCQHDVTAVTQRFSIDTWRGVERINVQVDRTGALGTIAFDWHSIGHAVTQAGVCLVLGYNTAALLA